MTEPVHSHPLTARTRQDDGRPLVLFFPVKAVFLFFVLLFSVPAFPQWVKPNTVTPVIDFTALQFDNS